MPTPPPIPPPGRRLTPADIERQRDRTLRILRARIDVARRRIVDQAAADFNRAGPGTFAQISCRIARLERVADVVSARLGGIHEASGNRSTVRL